MSSEKDEIIEPFLAILLLCLFPACAGAYTPQERLLQATNTYYEAFRWGKVQKMSEYIPPENRENFVANQNIAFREMKVVDYEIRESKFDKDRKNAWVTFVFSWHSKDETYVRETVVVDRWASRDGKWYRVGQTILQEQ